MKVGQKLMELLNSFLRVGSVLLVLLLEISLLGFVVYTLQRSAVYAYIVMQLFSVPLIYVLVEKEARYKLSWVLIIFLLPGAGFPAVTSSGAASGNSAGSTAASARPSGRWASSCPSARKRRRAPPRPFPTKRPWEAIWPGRAIPCTNARTAVFFPAVRTSTPA